ncbi:hypothetical protein [Candidatus Nanohalococcus occultus]|uniref:Uncharacterized protein n=1 Tax=Candidatus Nanohalococcus occultus TaxID=2978047 RepID=A0ABY8CJY4_9ARCH|nr:hypothetical protein SVXNc_0943 [Candidatus Nanohaloarchaeota archaeon SVXNc]
MTDQLYREKLDSKEEVQDWMEAALGGELDEGIYELDVKNVEEDMSYPEDRVTPGFTAPHSISDLQCVARVSKDSIKENRSELESFLAESYSSEQFLGTGFYGATSKRGSEMTVSRACYFE